MKKKSIFALVNLIAIVGLLSACSGGGGDSSAEAEVVLFLTGTGFDDDALVVSLRNDGSGDIYVGGRFTTYNGTPSNRIIRLNIDGSVDSGFNIGAGFNNTIWSIELAADGSGDVYVGGEFTSFNGITTNRIARLNSDGSFDTGFDSMTGFNNIVYSIAPETDGSVYVGGVFTSYRGVNRNRIARIDSNGSSNGTFAPGVGFNGDVNELVLANDSSGDLYVVGNFTGYQGVSHEYIVRINSDASVEGSFATGSSFDNQAISVAATADGSGDIYVGGVFTLYRGNNRSQIARIDSSGANDGGFNPGDGFNLSVFSVMPTGNGGAEIYAGGIFSTYDSINVGRIARIDGTGALDLGFPAGAGFSGAVQDILPLNDGSGSLYVVGEFAQYNGIDAGRIIRFDSAGQPN